MKHHSGILEADQLAEMIGVQCYSDFLNDNDDACTTEDDESRLYTQWVRTVFLTAERALQEHDMDAVVCSKGRGKRRYTVYRVFPAQSWELAARKVVDTINGYGMFEFGSSTELLRSGPYASYKQAVLSHLHWLKERPKVYGTQSYARYFEVQF